MSMYRAQMVEGPGMFFAMLSGAMLLGWGVMNWAASNAPEIAEILMFGWLYLSSPAGYRLHARSRPA